MTKLSRSTLSQISKEVSGPGYDPSSVRIGVVHIGPGAFFRAHQAAYFDQLLARDPRWGVCAVALNSSGVRDALAGQDGLYVLAELDANTHFHVIGAIRDLLVAHERPDAVLAALGAPDVKLVTLTVTEKGYGLKADGALDLANPAVRHDLDHPDAPPTSVVGWLAAGLRVRRAAQHAPFTTLSCDNLSDNGGKLGKAVVAFARAAGDNPLADWIAEHAPFPRTMVDSITPATDDALRVRVAATAGLEDAWPIQRESFTQWIIEDVRGSVIGTPEGPDLASVGATLTSDVGLFERAKLRLLNGPHSTLAYIGVLAGLETVAQAMSTPALRRFVEVLMREDISPTLTSGEGLDCDAYIDAILARFANPALRHELAQIAWDGSKKLPFRLLPTIIETLEAGRPVTRLATPIAAWMVFVRARLEGGVTLVDPLAPKLAEVVAGDPAKDVEQFMALRDIFPESLANNATFLAAVTTAHGALTMDPLGALH